MLQQTDARSLKHSRSRQMTAATEQLWQLNNHESRTTRKANNCKGKQPWEQSLLSKHPLLLPLPCGFLLYQVWLLAPLAEWLPLPTPVLFLQPCSPAVDCCLPHSCHSYYEASVAANAVAPALCLFALQDTVAGTASQVVANTSAGSVAIITGIRVA